MGFSFDFLIPFESDERIMAKLIKPPFARRVCCTVGRTKMKCIVPMTNPNSFFTETEWKCDDLEANVAFVTHLRIIWKLYAVSYRASLTNIFRPSSVKIEIISEGWDEGIHHFKTLT